MKISTPWLLALSTAALTACGSAEEPDADDDGAEAAPDKVFEEPPVVTDDDAARAQLLDLRPGVPWEIQVEDQDPTAKHPAGFYHVERSWPVLSPGQFVDFTLNLSASESLAAFVIPWDTIGDIDLYLYKWNGSTWQWVKDSRKLAGYVDPIYTPPYTAGWDGLYLLRMKCYEYRGDCNFGSSISIGDDEQFQTLSFYLNQRSFTDNNAKCKNSAGAWVADGECMCAPSSAAMGLVAGGKRRTDELRSAALDLFTTNNAYGAANRVRLMDRLKTSYSYDDCREIVSPSAADIRYHLRYRYLVLFRGSSLSSAGHYVQVRGYKTEGGVFKLRLNDPYGAWASKNVWNPRNTTSAGSTSGQDITVDYAALAQPEHSLIVCK